MYGAAGEIFRSYAVYDVIFFPNLDNFRGGVRRVRPPLGSAPDNMWYSMILTLSRRYRMCGLESICGLRIEYWNKYKYIVTLFLTQHMRVFRENVHNTQTIRPGIGYSVTLHIFEFHIYYFNCYPNLYIFRTEVNNNFEKGNIFFPFNNRAFGGRYTNVSVLPGPISCRRQNGIATVNWFPCLILLTSLFVSTNCSNLAPDGSFWAGFVSGGR